MSRQPAAILAGLLAMCGALIGLGTLEANVSLDSVADLWGDTLRDADEGAARLASVHPADEAAMGARQATVMMSAYNEDPVDSAYVSAVGALLLGAGRRPDFRHCRVALQRALRGRNAARGRSGTAAGESKSADRPRARRE